MVVSEMRVGGRLVFGSYGKSDDDITDIVWTKVSQNNDFMASDSVVSMQFDQKERMSSNGARRDSGNNFFLQSNVFGFLNANEIDWWVATHAADEAPYENIPGFLYQFNEWELACLEPREITVRVPPGSKREFGESVRIQCKVSLPAISELMNTHDTYPDEGERFEALPDFLTAATRTSDHRSASAIVCYQHDRGAFIKSACNLCKIYPVIRLRGDMPLLYDDPQLYYPDMPEEYFLGASSDEHLAILSEQ